MWTSIAGDDVEVALELGLFTFLVVVILVVYNNNRNKSRFPPGPWGWPITGHLHLLSDLPHQALRDVSAKYGPIIGLRLGQRPAVIVSSPQLAKEVLLTQDKVFANRPPHQFTSDLFYQDNILFANYGPEWRKRRKACMVELFTSKRLQELEYVRQEEMAAFLQTIADHSEGGTRPVDFGKCVGQMSSRLVMRLLQSQPASQVAGENLHDLIADVEEQASVTLGDLIPWLSWLDFGRRKRSMRAVHARIDKVLTQMLADRKQSCARYDDLLQALLSKSGAADDQEEAGAAPTPPPADALTSHEIKAIMLDMIAAGIHTTSLTLQWAVAELLKNPHCLRRLQKEVDSVALLSGSSGSAAGRRKKQITDADVAKLTYLKCIAKEVFRLHPVVPLLLPRISAEECKVNGYIIPADTLMFVNVWAIGRDERVWPNATRFMPERFEGKDTDLKGQHHELLPFGSGRRVCLGMLLGLSIVEVTLANIVNRFDWELPAGETPASLNMDERTGITVNRATPVLAIPKPRQMN